MALEVRAARTPEEVAAAGAVVAEAYTAQLLADHRYRSTLADAGDRAKDALLLVAVDDDGPVLGSVTYTLAGGRYAEVSRPGEAEFRMLGVRPSAAGRGVGRALVESCVERARADGASAVAICTLEEMTSARRIYDQLGFVRDPERDWRPVPQIALLGYVLRLRPPDPGGAARP